MFAEKYHSEIVAILAKYPPDRKQSAVMPLLFLAQREYGRITARSLVEIAEIIEVDPTAVGSLVGFYSLFHHKEEGEHRIQICIDLPCALRGSEKFAADLCQALGIELGGTTADGKITVEGVMCLAACDKAPMFQVQDASGIHYHELQTVESALALIENLRAGGADV